MRLSPLHALSCALLTQAAHLRLTIPSTPLLPHPSILPPSTHATLTTLSHIYSSPILVDNSFDFRNVSAGSYLLDVYSHSHIFVPLRVDVSVGGEGEKIEVWGTFRGNEWGNKGEKVEVSEVAGRIGVWGFEGKCVGGKEYFIERAGFSPLSLLKNPMILIAGFSMVIVFGMPYIMDNMDPELKAEFEERQKTGGITGGAQANPLQNFDAAAWLAGSTTGSSTPKRSEGSAHVEKGITR